MAHGHGHSHGAAAHHGHDHAAPAGFGRAFAIGIGLNLAYVVAEALAGLKTGSMALLADAGHNLSDVLGLAIAWGAMALAGRPATARYTYGLKRSTILAALGNAVILMFACGAIAVEATRRLADPQPVPGVAVMIVAGIGIGVNALTAWLFMRGKGGDINIRGAWLHMVADAAISAAVVVAGLLIVKTGAFWIDPALSLIVVAVIVRGTWGLLRDATAMAMDAVPAGIDTAAVTAFLAGRPGVAAVHHLHVWPIGTTDTAMTVHLLMPGGHPGDAELATLGHDIEDRFSIGHVTIQVEIGGDECRNAACA